MPRRGQLACHANVTVSRRGMVQLFVVEFEVCLYIRGFIENVASTQQIGGFSY